MSHINEYGEPVLSEQFAHRKLPLHEQKILEFYRNRFDQVYLAYHLPFTFKVKDLPQAAWLPSALTEEVLSQYAGNRNCRRYLQEKYNFEVVPACVLMANADCETEQQLIRAIHTENYYDCFGTPTDDDKRRNELLKIYFDDQVIGWPDDRDIAEYMQAGISSLFKSCAIERIFVSAMFGAVEELSFRVGSIIDLLPWQLHNKGASGNYIYDEAGTILIAHESFEYITLFCGKGKLLEKAGVQNLFAGFWCDEETVAAWPWTEYQAPEPRLPAPPQVFSPSDYELRQPLEFDLHRKFSYALKETDKTRIFENFPSATRQKILRDLALSDEENIVLLSICDDNNYAVLTCDEIIWKAGDSFGRLAIRDAVQLNCVGGLTDERYRGRWCYFDNGRIVTFEHPLSISLSREQSIMHSSPLVFVKDSSGSFYEFKIEHGASIQIISAQIDAYRKFLLVRKPDLGPKP